VTAPDKKPPSPQDLLRAALEGDIAEVRRLTAAGATPEADSQETAEVLRRAENEQSPHAALRKGLLETLVLHQQHGRINAAMYLAAYNGFDNVVAHFLEKSANDPLALNVALFAAVRAGHAGLAQKLLDAGADAAFKNGLPLRAAIDAGSEAMADMLVHAGAPRSEGLAHAAARGDIAMAAYLLRREDDVKPALEKICHTLSDKRSLAEGTRVLDVQSAADMLLALAEARGDNMPDLLTWVSLATARDGAGAMVEVIARHPRFTEMKPEDKYDLLDLLTQVLFTGLRKISHADGPRSVETLLAAGGAQRVLEQAIYAGDGEMVVSAIRAGADARRDHAKALHLAETEAFQNPRQAQRAILQDVRLSIAAQSVMDEKRASEILTRADADALLTALRAPAGRADSSGLMCVIAAGRAEALAVLLDKTDAALVAGDFFATDKHGYCALDTLADRRQQEWLFSPLLWRGRRAEYMELWSALPDDWQQAQLVHHEHLLRTLDVDRQQAALQQKADENDFRLPQRRKGARPPPQP